MFGRENIIGVLLLLLCTVVAGILVYSIITGERIDFALPREVSMGLGIAFMGLLVFGFVRSGFFRRFRGDGTPPTNRQWPSPTTGQKSLWDRLRGR